MSRYALFTPRSRAPRAVPSLDLARDGYRFAGHLTPPEDTLACLTRLPLAPDTLLIAVETGRVLWAIGADFCGEANLLDLLGMPCDPGLWPPARARLVAQALADLTGVPEARRPVDEPRLAA